MIQNLNKHIETQGVSFGSGMGYSGLSDGLAIEFDFNTNDDMGDPTYPHVSV